MCKTVFKNCDLGYIYHWLEFCFEASAVLLI